MSSLDEAEKINPFTRFNHNIEDGIMDLIKNILAKKAEVQLSAQSNFDNLFRGGHRVVIASITPMEKGFFVANAFRKPNALADAFIFSQGVFAETVKPKLINALMGFSIKNIEFVRNSNGLDNYFEDGLVPEYNYLKKFHNKKSVAEGYTLKLVTNYQEIETGMSTDDGKAIYVLLSVEGAHSFRNIVPVTSEIRANQNRQYTPGELNSIEDGAGLVKNIETMKKWKHVPLFVTVMHHFWNGMGGHARSLNKMVGEMLNQNEGINQGLSLTGKLVIRELLKDTNGPRVLVDIKHMSVNSRREFYQMLDTEPQFKNKKIPILCSHTGMAAGIDTLNELAQVNDKAEEENKQNYFHKAQINLCGEDIRRIAASGGLIGIQLDEKRVAGAGFVQERLRSKNMNELMNAASELIMANVFMIVKAVNDIKGWDLCAIGSDYDGLINHLDPFPTSASMTIFRDEIEFYLHNLHPIVEPGTGKVIFSVAQQRTLMMGLTPEKIAEKLFSANTMAFLKKNFNR